MKRDWDWIRYVIFTWLFYICLTVAIVTLLLVATNH